MARWHRFWTAPLLALALLAPNAAAQEPKTGKFYPVPSLGFEVKVPLDWETIPPEPTERNLIVKFDPKNLKYIWVGKGDQLFTHCWIVKFDRRKKEAATDGAADGKPKFDFGNGEKDILAWVKGGGAGPSFTAEGTPKEIEVNKVPAKIHLFSNTKTWEEPVKLFACVYKLEPDVDVALVFNGPGDPKKWGKWENSFEEMAKSLRRLKVKDPGKPTAAVDPSTLTLRDKKRAELQEKLRDTPAWKLYESPNYFIVSSNPDRAFIDELMARLEAIRSIYEQDYPADKIAELKKLAAETATKDPGAKKEEEAENEIAKAILGGADPKELSRCSIVRVCKDAEQYYSYGGPGGSAGYWSWVAGELVLYDDSKVGGKGDTWAVLNHEAFHQFIFYFYGNISPHSWYNEGTGDFYSGYEYKNKRFKLEKFQWRVGTIKAAIQSGNHVPLKDFVRWSQAEYYGQNKLGVDGGQNYAQGWSLIYFLRTGKKANARGWDPAWDGILETYLRELAMTNSTDKAVEKAFENIDMDALEKAWIDYTK